MGRNRKLENSVHWEGGKLRNTHLFSPSAALFVANGLYCSHPYGTKAYHDFWNEEMRRCIEGYTVDGVRITGYHYFYLNYYQLDVTIDPTAPTSQKLRSFPRFWKIDYDFFHLIEHGEKLGKNLCVIKSRGSGVSEKCASMGVRDFVFSYRTEAGVKHNKVFYFAAFDKYLTGDGIFNKCSDGIEFVTQNTQGAFKHLRQVKNQDLHKKASYKDKQGNEVQTGGEVIGVVVDKVDKVRGKRGFKLMFEESGAFPKLEEAIEVATPLVNDGGVVTGMIISWGTSNSDYKGLEGLKNMFNNPDAYEMLKFKDFYADKDFDPKDIPHDWRDWLAEEDSQGTGFFMPVFSAMTKFMDKDGNYEAEEAMEWLKSMREKKKGTPAYDIFVGDRPFTPAEALRRHGTSMFNTVKIGKQLSDISTGVLDIKPEAGNLFWKYEENSRIFGVEWKPSPNGKILIIEHPMKARDNGSYQNLYVSGIDSIDKGTATSAVGAKGSQFCQLVKKRTFGIGTGDIYVAMYRDRPSDIREAYENSLKLLHYYDCDVNIEDSRISIVSYYRENNGFSRLIKRPRIARTDKQGRRPTNLIGTPASPRVIGHYLSLINDYVEDFCHLVYFEDMLHEMRDYDYENKTKFDIIAAMGMCELYDEELGNLAAGIYREQEKEQFKGIGWYTDSDGRRVFGSLGNKHNETWQNQLLERGRSLRIDSFAR